MSKRFGWTRVRQAFLTLGLAASAAGHAGAAQISPDTPVMVYNTVGSSVDASSGVSGTPVVSFVPLTGSSFLAPSGLSFGKFVVAALPDGQTTTYTDTPFHIMLTATGLNGAAPSPNETPIEVSGKLNGTVTGSGQSSVVASFTGMSDPTFRTGGYENTLALPSSMALAPSTSNGGVTTAQALLTSAAAATTPATDGTPAAAAIPEPSTALLFVATLGGLAARRRLLTLKAAAV